MKAKFKKEKAFPSPVPFSFWLHIPYERQAFRRLSYGNFRADFVTHSSCGRAPRSFTGEALENANGAVLGGHPQTAAEETSALGKLDLLSATSTSTEVALVSVH